MGDGVIKLEREREREREISKCQYQKAGVCRREDSAKLTGRKEGTVKTISSSIGIVKLV